MENLGWGQAHQKTLGNVKATETEALHGKKQEKLNISAAICTAYNIKYKMSVWGCQRFNSYILLSEPWNAALMVGLRQPLANRAVFKTQKWNHVLHFGCTCLSKYGFIVAAAEAEAVA